MSHPRVSLKVRPLAHYRGELPRYESLGASGFDVRACLDRSIFVAPHGRVMIPTGLSFEVSQGYEIQVRPRSGLAAKKGLTVLNSPGTIDADYRGEVKIILVNLSDKPVEICDQDRIAQFVLCPVVQASFELVDSLSTTERGAGGFGSTGVGAEFHP